ncbi:MAG TPA: nucleotide exchange factor GrpE [Thermohalobaculum sp.]|nr:nucleotide exchange factor GrpE [Thermohalobaculum sp.]
MADKKANTLNDEEAALAAVPDGSFNIEDIMPGLAEEIEAAATAAEASLQTVTPAGVIAQLEADCYGLKDKLLRALAESENVRRRAERERKDAEAYGGTKLARDLLGVYDSLARTLEAADDTMREQAKGFIEGVELTQRELLNAFSKHKIEKVVPATGEKFDPNRHQAMFEAPIPGAEPGTVIEVMQAGFTIADRLLRPALVGVARAAPVPVAEAESEDNRAE